MDVVRRIGSNYNVPPFDPADVAAMRTGIQCQPGSYWLGRYCSHKPRSPAWFDTCASGPETRPRAILRAHGRCPDGLACVPARDLMGLPRIRCGPYPSTPTEADFALQQGIVWDEVERFYAMVLVSNRYAKVLLRAGEQDWRRWSISWRIIRAIRHASVSAVVQQQQPPGRDPDQSGSSGAGPSSSYSASTSTSTSAGFAVYKNDEREPLCTATTSEPLTCQPERLAPLGQGDRLNVALLDTDVVQTAVDLIVDLFIVEADAFPLIKSKGKGPM